MVNTAGLETIGYFCWWTLNKVRISKEDFNSLCAKVGLPYSIKIDKEKEVALRRSAFLKAQREINQKEKGLIVRKIDKNSEVYVFGLVDESLDKKQEALNYNHSATLHFHIESGVLNCDKPHRAFDLIKAKYDEYQGFMNADDVRQELLNCISQYHKVSVRSRGGIYFVPEKYSKEVESLENFVEGLNDFSEEKGCFLSVAPQINVERSRKSIYKAFTASLKDRIAEFKNELEDKQFRSSTLKNRIEEFKTLRQDIEFYKDALSFQVEDLTKDLDNLTDDVRKRITE